MDVTKQREEFNKIAGKIQVEFDKYLQAKNGIKSEFEPVARELFSKLLETVTKKTHLVLDIEEDIEPEEEKFKLHLVAVGPTKSKDSIKLYFMDGDEEKSADINYFGKTKSTKIMLDILEQL